MTIGTVIGVLILGVTVGGMSYAHHLRVMLNLRLEHEREMWQMRERANYRRERAGLRALEAAYAAPDPYEKGPA